MTVVFGRWWQVRGKGEFDPRQGTKGPTRPNWFPSSSHSLHQLLVVSRYEEEEEEEEETGCGLLFGPGDDCDGGGGEAGAVRPRVGQR